MSLVNMRFTDFWPLGFELSTISMGFIYAKTPPNMKHYLLLTSNQCLDVQSL